MAKSFIDLMLKEAQADEILSKLNKAVAARRLPADYPGPSSGSRWSYRHLPGPQHHSQIFSRRDSAPERGGHTGRGDQKGSQDSRSIYVLSYLVTRAFTSSKR